MQLSLSSNGEDPIVYVAGKISADNYHELRKLLDELSEQQPKRVYLDFQGVTFIDSSGLGLLLGVNKRYGRDGIQLIIQNTPEKVMTLFRLTHMMNFFRFK